MEKRCVTNLTGHVQWMWIRRLIIDGRFLSSCLEDSGGDPGSFVELGQEKILWLIVCKILQDFLFLHTLFILTAVVYIHLNIHFYSSLLFDCGICWGGQQRLCIHVPLCALRGEWSAWCSSPRWTSSLRAIPGPGRGPPAGGASVRAPGLGCSMSSGSAGGPRVVLLADRGCPCARRRRGVEIKSSVTSPLMGRGITARSCNWWCCLHLCAKPSKHAVGGWQGCVGFSRLGLKFKPTVQL